jgi:hypothetical protein
MPVIHMVNVLSVEPGEGFKLKVVLSNGKQGVFDVAPYLDRGMFHELRDGAYFRRVKVSFGGIAWPHEQDFSGDTIEHELQSVVVAGRTDAA